MTGLEPDPELPELPTLAGVVAAPLVLVVTGRVVDAGLLVAGFAADPAPVEAARLLWVLSGFAAAPEVALEPVAGVDAAAPGARDPAEDFARLAVVRTAAVPV